MARTHPGFILLLLVLAGLVSACSNTRVPDLRQDVEREGIIPQGWEPMPLRVGVAPLRSALELDEARQNTEEARRWVLSPDAARLNGGPDSLHSKLLAVFRDYEIFETVVPIEGATPDMSSADLQAQALRQGLDVVMIPNLRRQDVGYVGTNSAYGWNMFVWWMVSPVFSWWVADEDFDANVHVDLALYPASGGEALTRKRLEPRDPVVRSLDVWDEGFHLFSIFTTPRHFDESNWERIGGLLMPIADVELQKSALRYATGDLDELRRQQEFMDRVRRRVALVIGVDGMLPLTRHAVRDAQEFAAQFAEAGDMAIPGPAMRTVLGTQATRARVEQAARELSGLARGNDDVILYFSGVGSATIDGELMLDLTEPFAGEVERIGLQELLDTLLLNNPRSVTVILDCSFTAPGDRRCATTRRDISILRERGFTDSLYTPVIERFRERGIRVNFLAASDAVVDAPEPMPALEIEELGHGLFSSFALHALSGAADTDDSGAVTIDDFIRFTRKNVSRIGSLEGTTQTGWFDIEEDAGAMRLPSGRRAPILTR
jgi:hypothetical protein